MFARQAYTWKTGWIQVRGTYIVLHVRAACWVVQVYQWSVQRLGFNKALGLVQTLLVAAEALYAKCVRCPCNRTLWCSSPAAALDCLLGRPGPLLGALAKALGLGPGFCFTAGLLRPALAGAEGSCLCERLLR